MAAKKKKVCGRLRKEQEQLEKDLELLAISAKLEVLDLLVVLYAMLYCAFTMKDIYDRRVLLFRYDIV